MKKSTLIIGLPGTGKFERAMRLIGPGKWVAQFFSIDDYIKKKFKPETDFLLFKGLDLLTNAQHQTFITRLALQEDAILNGEKHPMPEIMVLCDGNIIDTLPECFLTDNWIVLNCYH